jgi:hypothetical protein
VEFTTNNEGFCDKMKSFCLRAQLVSIQIIKVMRRVAVPAKPIFSAKGFAIP